MTHCFTVLRFESIMVSEPYISRNLFDLWLVKIFIWSVLIGQILNGQFLLVKTDLLDDYITVSRNTSNTDLTNESYNMTHPPYGMTHSLWLIIVQSETLFDRWKVFDCNKGITCGDKPPTKKTSFYLSEHMIDFDDVIIAWATGCFKWIAICLFVQESGWNIWDLMIDSLDLGKPRFQNFIKS